MGRVSWEYKKKRYILAPSVLGPNLQLPAHRLISPNSFYETLNKEKLSPINYKHFSFWSGKQFRVGVRVRVNSVRTWRISDP